jgi:hypothetical protein
METLKKQFNVEINVLNVNRREGRVFGGFLRVFEGVLEVSLYTVLLLIKSTY